MARTSSSGSRRWGTRSRAARRGLLGVGLLLAGTAGVTGWTAVAVAPATAAGATTSTVDLSYTCASTTTLASVSDLPVPVTVEVTAPTTVTTGQSFTVSATLTPSISSALAAVGGIPFSALGITGVAVTQASVDVSAAGATPTTLTDSAEELPLSLTVAQISTPVTLTLAPLTFTAGSSPGTATFTAGDADLTATIVGGSLDGFSVPVTCTADSTNPPLASVTITQAAAPAPVVSSVSPTSGPVTGGTSVTISGSGFTGATAVDFGTVPATSFTVNGDTSITATSPTATSAGEVDVTIVGPGGTSATSAADQFTYTVVPGPVTIAYTCSETTPVPLSGIGETVTLDTTAPASVVAGQSFTVDTSATITLPGLPPIAGIGTITGISLDSASVTVDATGVTPTSQADGAEGLPITVPPLEVPTPVTTDLVPLTFAAGAPGTAIFTAGGFTFTAAVVGGSLSGVAEPLTCTPNAGNPPLASVTITAPPPSVTAVSPASGPAAGGTSVTITGTGLTGATAVDFGTTPATDVDVVSDSEITATAPSGSGTVGVTVTTPGGTSNAEPFTYQPAPTVTAVFPGYGPTSGYSLVWVFGSNFTDVSAVTYGGDAALWLTFFPNLMLTLTPPAARPGTVSVQVTAAGGTSATSKGGQYTYVPRSR